MNVNINTSEDDFWENHATFDVSASYLMLGIWGMAIGNLTETEIWCYN